MWLEQDDLPMQMPAGMPDMGGQPNMPNDQGDPNIANMPDGEPSQDMGDDDITNDPQSPDMEDFSDNSSDFEEWRKEFFDLAIKGDANLILDAIGQVKDRKLTAPQRRFVEDNFQIALLRQDANFDKASKEIRKLMNQELDRNNPSVSIMEHLKNTLQSYPVINDIFVKLAGQGAFKAELHRRMIGALLGAVQTGSGGNRQDLIYPARDYSINISTRFYTEFGNVNIGKWTLQEDDPGRYLTEPELERLQEGSPEEKRVLRRRICLESISTKFSTRAFLVHVLEPDTGTLHSFAWDVSEALHAGYKEGLLVVRKRKSSFRDAMIDDNGDILPLFEYSINYKQNTGELNKFGVSQSEEVPFLEQRNGSLYLLADSALLQQISGGMPGMRYHSQPYQGNPSDIIMLMRCAPSTVEMMMRRC